MVNKPFTVGGEGATVNRVTEASGSADNCPTCAAAQKISGTLVAGAGNNIFTLDSVPLIDQGSSGSAMSLGNRFATTNANTAINANDLHLDTGAGADAVGVTVQAAQSSGVVNIGITSATSTFYAVYWGSERNDTGSSVQVSSQADETGITVVLSETGPATGVFRLTILATSSASNAGADPPELQVSQDDVVTLRYADANPAVTVSATLQIASTLAHTHTDTYTGACRHCICTVGVGSGVDDPHCRKVEKSVKASVTTPSDS